MINVTEMEKMASGMQSKVFDQTENVLYKQDYLGTEGLSEYVASKLLEGSEVEYTSYMPCQFMMGNREVTGCKSENFLKPGERLVSTYELLENEYHIDIAKEVAHIEDIGDIDPAWFEGCSTVGVSAGASTPENQIRELIEYLEQL